MRSILTIESSYVRLCIFSVALQAIIERRYYGAAVRDTESASLSRAQQQEEDHLKQTVNAARTILRTVVDDLLPDGYLKCVPVRAYSRILGAALFLLKVRVLRKSSRDITSKLTSSVMRSWNQRDRRHHIPHPNRPYCCWPADLYYRRYAPQPSMGRFN